MTTEVPKTDMPLLTGLLAGKSVMAAAPMALGALKMVTGGGAAAASVGGGASGAVGALGMAAKLVGPLSKMAS